MKIEIPLADFQKQKVIEKTNAYLELHPGYIHICFDYLADDVINDDEEDESLWRWESGRRTYRDEYILRKAVAGLELSKGDNSWRVYLTSYSNNWHLVIHFKKFGQAKPVFDQLQNWLIQDAQTQADIPG